MFLFFFSLVTVMTTDTCTQCELVVSTVSKDFCIGTIHFGETRLLEILLRVYLPLILEPGRESKLQISRTSSQIT